MDGRISSVATIIIPSKNPSRNKEVLQYFILDYNNVRLVPSFKQKGIVLS